MLVSIYIKNFVLIEKLDIEFSNNFSIITGETGAGKSILLGALSLIQGKRADISYLKNKDEKCVVETNFNISKYNLKYFFDFNKLDYQDNTIIRREILINGKSRAFINDSPVNLQQLQQLSDYLIDIHSQQHTRELNQESFQFEIIDSISKNFEEINKYQKILKEYKASKNLLIKLNNEQQTASKEQDYNTFLLEELVFAKFFVGEQEDLESKLQQLSNIELIKENLSKSLLIANDENTGVKVNLNEIKFSLQQISSFSSTYDEYNQRINSLLIEFSDIIFDIDKLSENLINNPADLEIVSQKLQKIYNLQKKHNVKTIQELLIIQTELENKVIAVNDLELRIKKGSQIIFKQEKELNDIADKISENRKKTIPFLIEKIILMLKELGMPDIKIKIDLINHSNFLNNGKDEISFLIAINKGTNFGLLKKVASGGEMSRIMLAIKAILASYSKLPTIFFDEIDTGISGEIVNKMGEIMKEMSQNMQVFAITHLPQIAAKGTQHYKVFKTINKETTITDIKLLSMPQRILEIAEMLSGKDISESAMNHAKTLLN